jgi:hypothetical protein
MRQGEAEEVFMGDKTVGEWHCRVRQGFLAVALLVLLALLGGCQVEEELQLHADGSGSHRVKVSVPKDFGEALQALKQKAIGQHYHLVEEGQAGDSRFLVMARDFANVSELNDNEDTFALNIDAAGAFRRRYRLDVAYKGNAAVMNFERVLRVRMPAAVDTSTAGQVSSDRVEWSCSRGGQLRVVASGFAMPTPARLSSAVDQWFMRDTLIFVRDGELWSAAPDGSGAKSSGIRGVGATSVAETGAVTYDRFIPGSTQAQDLNIYLLEGGIGSPPRQLTSDGQSIWPKISPDGRSIVYEKFAWSGQAMKGQGKGLWLYDIAAGQERELVGADARANSGAPLGLRKWRSDQVSWGADGQSLVLTREYQTDRGGLYLVDYIVRLPDGRTEQFDKYKPDGSYRAPLLAFDGGHVLASAWHGSEDGLIEEDTATRQARMIVPGVMAGSPVLSPDSSTIAFITRADPKGSDLWIVHRDGSALRKLTERPLADRLFGPHWAPDGQSVVATVFSDSGLPAEKMKVVSIDARSGRQETLATGARSGAFAREPRLSQVWLWLVKGALLLVAALIAAALILGLWRLGSRLASRRVPQVAPAAASLSRFCGACGKALPAAGAFCVNCGTKVG